MVSMKTNIFYWGWVIRLLVFAAIDYFFHTLTPQWAAPEYYFRNKIIFGFLWGLPILLTHISKNLGRFV